MAFEEITKPSVSDMKETPNLIDYQSTREDFDWYRDGFSGLDWLPDGGLNNAYEAVDRHVNNGKGKQKALIWIGKNGDEETYTYSQFKEESDKFGQVMKNLGMQRADRVFIFMDRIPELYFAAMGILKAGGVIAPLFSAFGPDPVRDRMEDAGASFLVTTPELKSKIDTMLPDIKTLQKVTTYTKFIPQSISIGMGFIV